MKDWIIERGGQFWDGEKWIHNLNAAERFNSRTRAWDRVNLDIDCNEEDDTITVIGWEG